jgi:hypothetical protein
LGKNAFREKGKEEGKRLYNPKSPFKRRKILDKEENGEDKGEQ